MCFFSNLSQTPPKLEKRFEAQFPDSTGYRPGDLNAFAFPATPIITNKDPRAILMGNWGLIPHWAKDDSIRKYTLNARVETIHEKPSFRSSIKNRCLIPADAFYEWQWLDPKGKNKQKYRICTADQQTFAFAGIFTVRFDPNTGDESLTYSILTTAANEFMAEIHNSKKRMPIILPNDLEGEWLANKLEAEQIPKVELVADKW